MVFELGTNKSGASDFEFRGRCAKPRILEPMAPLLVERFCVYHGPCVWLRCDLTTRHKSSSALAFGDSRGQTSHPNTGTGGSRRKIWKEEENGAALRKAEGKLRLAY